MKNQSLLSQLIGWTFGSIIFFLGVLNLVLIHPVPGLVYLFLALPFFPPLNQMLRRKFSISIPLAALVVLGLIIFWFTLGISDLAEMYGL